MKILPSNFWIQLYPSLSPQSIPNYVNFANFFQAILKVVKSPTNLFFLHEISLVSTLQTFYIVYKHQHNTICVEWNKFQVCKSTSHPDNKFLCGFSSYFLILNPFWISLVQLSEIISIFNPSEYRAFSLFLKEML